MKTEGLATVKWCESAGNVHGVELLKAYFIVTSVNSLERRSEVPGMKHKLCCGLRITFFTVDSGLNQLLTLIDLCYLPTAHCHRASVK